jgi:hypothetical protein
MTEEDIIREISQNTRLFARKIPLGPKICGKKEKEIQRILKDLESKDESSYGRYLLRALPEDTRLPGAL